MQNQIFLYIIGAGVAVIVISIVAVILAGSDILGNATLGSFTGFVPIARLVPLILLVVVLFGGGLLAKNYLGSRGGGGRRRRRR